MKDYGLKLSYEEIKNENEDKWSEWENELTSFVIHRLSEDNVKNNEIVSESQKKAWIDSFQFIKNNMDLENINPTLLFEYILPLTIYNRPDVIIPTKNKVIVLEFKRKDVPEKSDIKQAIHYREWLKNHHAVSHEKGMKIETYIICTTPNADTNNMYSIPILNSDTFNDTIYNSIKDEEECDFLDEWCESDFTVLPSMLEAIYEVYKTGDIPYLSDINENCLNQVNEIINDARENNKKALILISGVPGAGKTAVGQIVVFQHNKEKAGSAIYLSGNGPLVEVLQYEINKATGEKNAGENAILGIKNFKSAYFDTKMKKNYKVPQQSILIFDEAQRAWDTEKMHRGFSEPEGLLRVGDKIFNENGFAVIIGLYGNGQVIYTGEEKGMELWNNALNKHSDWEIFVPKNLSDDILEDRKHVKDDLFLPVSIRADFVNCSPWVESVISRENRDFEKEKIELEKLKNSPLELYVTRDFGLIKKFTKELNDKYPELKYGLLVSNFAEAKILTRKNGWELGYGRGNNQVKNGKYGPWFDHECKELTKAASVYGNQ